VLTRRIEFEYVPTIWGADPTMMLLVVVDDFVASLNQ
jgi:hypothetical protein